MAEKVRLRKTVPGFAVPPGVLEQLEKATAQGDGEAEEPSWAEVTHPEFRPLASRSPLHAGLQFPATDAPPDTPRLGSSAPAPERPEMPLVALPDQPSVAPETQGPPEVVVPRADPAPVIEAPSAEPVVAPTHKPLFAENVDWQRLWLATQRRPWRSLCLASVGTLPTMTIASGLAEVAWHHRGEVIRTIDATRLALSHLDACMHDIGARIARGERVIIALDSIMNKPASIALAQSAEAALVCAVLREGDLATARRTVAEIGVERVLGSVIVRTTRGS